MAHLPRCRSETLPVAQLAARKVPKPVVSLLRRVLAIDPAQRPASPRHLLVGVESCRARLARPNERQQWRRAAFRRHGSFERVCFVLIGVPVNSCVAQSKRSPLCDLVLPRHFDPLRDDPRFERIVASFAPESQLQRNLPASFPDSRGLPFDDLRDEMPRNLVAPRDQRPAERVLTCA
ncbi:hypothetical protein BH18VER2_BH18VER2_11370 [soil metagenome]